MRVVFAGSPEIAVPSLRAVSGVTKLVAVLTNPESQKGRGLVASATPVAIAAAEIAPGSRLPILAFEHLGGEAREAVAALSPDLLVSFAYGRIFGPKFLALFPLGGVNIHPSLLPRWRGPTPIPAAILHREAESGVSVQRLALAGADGPGIDAGDLLAVERIVLDPRETTVSLSRKAAEVGARLVADFLAAMVEGRHEARPQEGTPTYSTLLKKDDGLIDWNRPVEELDALVRAFDPWPGAFTRFRGLRLSILEAVAYPGRHWEGGGGGSMGAGTILGMGAGTNLGMGAGTILGMDKSLGLMVQGHDGFVALRRLQLQQKKALGWREFANGIRDLAGERLG